MLTYEDEPTIRFATLRRLDQEPGVKVCDLKVIPHLDAKPPFLAVGVLSELGNLLLHKAVFHLPASFEHAHLLNELDEIAESYKSARRDFFAHGRPQDQTAARDLSGTGLRGRWAGYG